LTDTTRDSRSVRERILDTAAELFYQQGGRAVGVDLVVARSGVAKTSLYRHFASKDDLIAAVLERDDSAYWRDWDEVSAHFAEPRSELEGHLRWIADYTGQPGYRGCPFINVATEFPADGHPARAVAVRHKQELRRRLADLVERVPVADAAVADQLLLLIDGAYVHGQLLSGATSPAAVLPAAGMAVLDAALSNQAGSGNTDPTEGD
jgi:AcrR family transcriptional regulator